MSWKRDLKLQLVLVYLFLLKVNPETKKNYGQKRTSSL